MTELPQRALTPTKIPSGGQSKRLQGHFVAQAFQPPDQGSADSVHVDPIKVIRTEFPVVFLTLQHVIGNLLRNYFQPDGGGRSKVPFCPRRSSRLTKDRRLRLTCTLPQCSNPSS